MFSEIGKRGEAKPQAPGEATNYEGAGGPKTVNEPKSGPNATVIEPVSEERVSEADFVRLIGPDYFNSDNEGDELEEINELWVPAKVQGEKVMFCVDSGASRVIMKSEQYLLIPANKRPKLASKNVMLRQADGTKVQIDGVATMTVQVGECKRQIQMYVAPVRDNLLGLNFLRKACAQIDLDKLQIVIGNERVDCRTRDDRPLYSLSQ